MMHGVASAVRVEKLVRRFGALTAVAGIDLVVDPGALFGLLGSNGAGKTTLLRMLTTLLPPSEGHAEVAGFDVVARPREVRRRIGYVPQLVSADGALTARENLSVSARLYGLPRALRAPRIDEALATTGLVSAADELVRGYSGGMIRRLEIAQAMLHRPAVLFLDEPTVGLDPTARHAVWDRLRQIRGGTTMVLTTHDMQEADALCDRIAILHRGSVVALGSPEELKTQVKPGATMDDVFAHFTGGEVEAGGNYRDISRTRRTAERLG